MSKPIKSLIKKSYQERFGDLSGAVLIDIRGVDSNTNNTIRAELAKKEIRVAVVTNNLAKAVLSETDLKGIEKLLEGPTALVYGGSSVVAVARELIEKAKAITNLQVKGAIMDGQLFGPNEMEALSKYPTREEAQAQVIQVILGPAGQLISAATSAGANIASLLKTIEEKLEKGEAITKVA